jgi:DNA-binding NarL/FixJ family response regulator
LDDEISVLVVDDHSLFRRGVIQTINEQQDMNVVAEADTAAGGLEKAKESLPDVALLDIKLSDGSGLDVARSMQRDCPYTKLILLTVLEDEETVLRALKDGAHGYVLKGVAAADLVSVVRSVYRGETYVTPSIAVRLLSELTTQRDKGAPANLLGQLSDREGSILDLVAQGKTNKEIATELFLSEKTVKHYMTNVLQKLHVRNRVEAALLIAREDTT